MKHPSSRALFAYWDERRGTRPAPERGDIDPAAIRHTLSDTYMLSVDFVGQHRFRLAGTRLCALFCREIKGEAFSELWSEKSRAQVADLLTAVTVESVGAVAGLTGRTADGTELDLEMLLLPLAHVGHARVRALGTLAPISIPYWIGERAVTALELGGMRHVGPTINHRKKRELVLQPEGGRARRGLVVYSGGRQN